MCMLLAAGAEKDSLLATGFNIFFKKLRTEFVKKPAHAGKIISAFSRQPNL